MRGELPEGWAEAPIAALCEKVRGVSFGHGEARSVGSPGYRAILRANNIEEDGLAFEDLVWVPASCVSRQQELQIGDVIVAMSSGSRTVVGKAAQLLTSWDGSFGAFCAALRPSPELNKRYFGLFLRTREYRSQISDLAAGTNINNLKNEHFENIDVPIAPIAEQHRIVAKLEQLLDKLTACQKRLESVSRLLKRFRQSVLAAACSGKLTADWREQHQQPSTGDLVDGDGPFALPQSWSWRSFQRLSRGITVGFVGPMAKEYVSSGVPFLRSQNVRSFRFDPTGLKYISRKFHERISKSRLEPGDVAIVRSGNSGIACVIPESLREANCADLVILKPASSLVAQFACMFLNSNAGQSHVNSVKVGIAQRHFNVGSMKATLLPCPPRPEQEEIVRRAEALLAVIDQIEARHEMAAAKVNDLIPSLLAKAFRGELVRTEAALARAEGREYEPASVLLDRIRASSKLERPKSVSSRLRATGQSRVRRRA